MLAQMATAEWIMVGVMLIGFLIVWLTMRNAAAELDARCTDIERRLDRLEDSVFQSVPKRNQRTMLG